MRSIHSIRAAALVLSIAAMPAAAQEPPPAPAPPSASASFTIFVKGVPVGSEQMSVARNADGWTVASSGRIGAPLDIVARRLQVRYSPDFRPLELVVDATVKGQLLSLRTTVSGATATSEITSGGQPTRKTDTIEPDAVLLPNPFFGPYEMLAERLRTAAPGTTIAVYAVPQMSFAIRVGDSSAEKIQTATRLVEARRTQITIMAPGIPLDAEIWGDDTGRLLRVSVPAQNLEVVREDIASVAARRVTVSRPGDEQVRIPANGFVLAGTLSRPSDAGMKPMPAVVLVGGSGPTDRDETVFGVPIFGQLAGALADAGYLVLRYDKRGVGQSGGRVEAATLTEFAEDLRSAIKFLQDRRDVDPKRLAAVGHSEGGSVAMIAASKDRSLDALVLVGTIGVTGSELNLEQVQRAVGRMNVPESEKQAKVELQKRIQAAVLTGSGWESIPPELRRQAETPWFKSFLAFDPSKVMADVRQPILIVQGELDTQVAPANADRLEALARARRNAPPLEVARIPGINHLLVPATTGEIDEYGTLKDKKISPAVASAIALWLQKTFAAASR